MTVFELIGYLTHYADHGKGNALVVVCDSRDNPSTDSNCIKDAVFMEWRDGESQVVLQTG